MKITNCNYFIHIYNRIWWNCVQNKISPNIETLLNGVLRPKVDNIPFASYFLINLDFLLPHIAHIDNIIVLPLLVFETFGFIFPIIFYTLNSKITYFRPETLIDSFILFNNITNAYFLPSVIRLFFSVSLLWLLIILMLSFNYRFFFSLIIVIKSS